MAQAAMETALSRLAMAALGVSAGTAARKRPTGPAAPAAAKTARGRHAPAAAARPSAVAGDFGHATHGALLACGRARCYARRVTCLQDACRAPHLAGRVSARRGRPPPSSLPFPLPLPLLSPAAPPPAAHAPTRRPRPRDRVSRRLTGRRRSAPRAVNSVIYDVDGGKRAIMFNRFPNPVNGEPSGIQRKVSLPPQIGQPRTPLPLPLPLRPEQRHVSVRSLSWIDFP